MRDIASEKVKVTSGMPPHFFCQSQRVSIRTHLTTCSISSFEQRKKFYVVRRCPALSILVYIAVTFYDIAYWVTDERSTFGRQDCCLFEWPGLTRYARWKKIMTSRSCLCETYLRVTCARAYALSGCWRRECISRAQAPTFCPVTARGIDWFALVRAEQQLHGSQNWTIFCCYYRRLVLSSRISSSLARYTYATGNYNLSANWLTQFVETGEPHEMPFVRPLYKKGKKNLVGTYSISGSSLVRMRCMISFGGIIGKFLTKIAYIATDLQYNCVLNPPFG